MTVKIVLVGAGDRGRIYTDWIKKNPKHMKLIGVAEPLKQRREQIRKLHNLDPSHCFDDWKELISSNLKFDGVIIATPDKMHSEPTLLFLNKGVHVLMEKPMALSQEEILEISKAAKNAEERGGSLTVCHVLRYSPFFFKIKEILSSGTIGNVQTMYHAENVSWYHFAHSYVRGNWNNSQTSSPIILAKSSHDLDIIHWLMDSKPVQVSSTSGRTVYIPENAPASAPHRCSNSCPIYDQCIYEAKKTYLYGMAIKKALSRSRGLIGLAAKFMVKFKRVSSIILPKYHIWKEWPTSTISDDLTKTGISKALKDGPYGRCIYHCDNNQPEHQETIIKFESGATASFRLHGLSHEEGRTLRIDGTKGSLMAKFGSGSEIRIALHGENRDKRISVKTDFIGHSEADRRLMEDWCQVFTGKKSRSSAEESVISHLLAFAAYEADKSGQVVKINITS